MKKIQRLTFLAVLVAQALILYIIEGMLPVPFITPGAKLGLSNIVTVTTLYLFGFRDTFIVVILRILLSTFFGGSVSSLIYSISGGLLSLLFMQLVKALGKKDISIMGVSITGAFFHNVGQVLSAAAMIQNINVVIYLPLLTVSGVGTGFFVGLTANYLLNALRKLPIHKMFDSNGA